MALVTHGLDALNTARKLPSKGNAPRIPQLDSHLLGAQGAPVRLSRKYPQIQPWGAASVTSSRIYPITILCLAGT